MRPSLPVVYSKEAGPVAELHDWGGASGREHLEIKLESEAWFTWLEAGSSFRFILWQAAGKSINFTVRAEKRGQRTYWQGWKTIGGQTRKKYIGPSAKMTKASLDQVGNWFDQQVQERTEADQTLKLYAAVADLSWLVEQLLGQCQEPSLVRRAQAELARIKHSFGN